MESIRLEDVLITKELRSRPSRPAECQRENEALHTLMGLFSAGSPDLLQVLAETLRTLCGADSAGICVENTFPEGSRACRWIATSGKVNHLLGQTMPWESPCGVVLEQWSTHLFCRPSRAFTALDPSLPGDMVEGLIVPWKLNSSVRGTCWVSAHSEEKTFDAEDLRLVESLATFVGAALQRTEMEERAEEQAAHKASAELANLLAHKINNPLQGLSNTLHLARNKTAAPELKTAEEQLHRINALVASILARNQLPEPSE